MLWVNVKCMERNGGVMSMNFKEPLGILVKSKLCGKKIRFVVYSLTEKGIITLKNQ